ncbi:MAG: hypothetical protein LPK09_00575, partial [Hymenobacteraceae bacterium]|nr:hypothetical protein [Hymenobacteraceae bacterium]
AAETDSAIEEAMDLSEKPVATSPEHLADAEPDTVKQTIAAVKALPIRQKSYKEISTLTGCDLNKVKSYIQNGKRNLKLYMEKHHAPR